MRRRSSELYQVDFVAALFGGFLLVWLSGMGEAEFPGDTGKRLAFFELSARTYYNRKDGTGEGWASLLPSELLGLGCAHPNVVGFIAGDRPILGCTMQNTEELNPAEKSEKNYRDRVVQAATVNGRTADHVLDAIDGAPIETLISDAGVLARARFAGIAISQLSTSDMKDAIQSVGFQPVAIGIIRDADLANGPKFIKFDPEGHLGAFIYITSRRPLANYRGATLADVDQYFFRNVPTTASFPNMRPDVNRIEVTLRLDKESGGACYQAKISLPALDNRAPLKPC